jgi:plastocyanin
MKTRIGTSTRQQIVAVAFLAVLSVHCGGDDSSGDEPATAADAGPSKTSDAGTTGKLDGATTPSIDAATKDTGVPVTNPGDASTAPHTDAATTPGVDAAVKADSGTTVVDSGTTVDTIETFNACTPDKYTDLSTGSAVIAFGGASGLKYVPPCITIAKGQKVTFNGAFSSHPLAPGIQGNTGAGTAGSPIKSTTTGTTAEFTFDAVGTFPYICTVHVGSGMAGSIHVK